jgi:hypothetical protein
MNERVGGWTALLAGTAAFTYAVAFVVLRHAGLSALCLTLVGLLSCAALVALYERLRPAEPGLARLALVFGASGALGAALHGAYDLANVIHVPASANPDLPSQVDPRGFMTFLVAGLGIGLTCWLIRRGQSGLPRGLGLLGYASALLMVALYLGRLIVLDATSPLILVPAVLNGFVVAPAWYAWLGLSQLRGGAPARAGARAAAPA